MKKYIIIATCVVLLIAVILFALNKLVQSQYGILLSNGLAVDVSNFYAQNQRLPFNWEEFVSWAEKNNTTHSWTLKELNGRFTLLWGAHITVNYPQDQKVFMVQDESCKKWEASVNEQILGECIMYNKEKEKETKTGTGVTNDSK